MAEKETQKPWLIDEGLNRIFVMVGAERVELRCTVSQHERYLELIETRRAEKDAADKAADEEAKARGEEKTASKTTLKENLVTTRVSSLDVASIALNPKPEIKYTKSDIEDLLDVDQIYLVAETWLQRKVYGPTLEQNPLLRPAATVASHPGRK